MTSNGNDDFFSDACDVDQHELLEDSSPETDEEQICSICKHTLVNPRLLSCLHAFCQGCLEKRKAQEKGRELMIVCPSCDQETILPRKGVSGLACDYISTNIQDMLAITNTSVECTSCKGQQLAIARCSDCAKLLCLHCEQAHQYMRCFEDHKVVSFEILKQAKEAVPIHKPVNCETHLNEPMKFFCYTCMIPLCNECVVVEHCAPEHQYERLGEAYERQKKELVSLIAESKGKMVYCEEATTSLQNALAELQAQHDNAKGLIDETLQTYKVVLEKRKNVVLEELKQIHKEKEIKIMEAFHCIDKVEKKIVDANKFTSRLLEHGSAAEVLSLRQVVSAQLMNLINNTPAPEVNTNIEFVTDMDKFQSAIQTAFGYFRQLESPAVTATTTPQQETPPPQSLSLANCPPSSVTSSPVSMPSSYDGELGISSPLLPLSTIQEYNLTALASLATNTETNVSSASSPSPSFTLNDLLTGDLASTSHAMKNLEALVKLNNVSLNEPGEKDVSPPPQNFLENPNPFSSNFLGVLTEMVVNGGPLNGAAGPAPLLGRVSPIDSIPPVLSPTINGVPAILPPPLAGVGTGLLATASNGVLGNAIPFSARNGTKAAQPMQVRFKFGTLGPAKNQFNSPHGFCLGVEEDIIVADTNNHRIQIFEKNGNFKFQFGIPGKEEGQLWYPRKVAVMKASGKFVVCDRGNERSRMQIFTKNGHFIKKIAIRYIDIVAGLAVSSQGHIVAVDSVSPTVFVISDNGDLLSWFDCSDHMREPSDLAINGKEYFVCDFKGHCVVVFNELGTFLRRIGCESITNFPNGIDISDAGDVLVGDSHGNRFHVAVFNRNGDHICEFECPYVKVSRCCGLKITSEGFIVTLAKNNHHVLVLNTLYIV
ncbi:B-box type zinc finger protein ncl-1 isoform X2 [Macrosteles quadrilineatus]|uniref:B-box type zinc finger protein ncl-1 isoform X2 n=1 Tax=Macrosteles quadrilineatus TaxID=74068 RepID=UPI0023E0E9DD|nr:B-box type zinc finger protein ncl-1 isoform X2 [Macrosteles quadrilineatus]